jgi:putative transposase
MLNVEIDQHLEGEAAAPGSEGDSSGNHRNETVITDTGQVELEIPRDRRGTFEPQADREVPAAASP